MVEIPHRHQVAVFGYAGKAEHAQLIALGRVKKTLAGRVIGVMAPLYFMIVGLLVEEAFRGRGIGRMSAARRGRLFALSPELARFALHHGYRLKDPPLYEKRFSGELEDWWRGTVPGIVFSWKKTRTEDLERLP